MRRSASSLVGLLSWGILASSSLAATPTPTVPPCPLHDLGSGLPVSTSGTTASSPSGFNPPCVNAASSPEETFLYTPPVTGSYQIDTAGSGFDTVLYVRQGSCNGIGLACNDQFEGNTSFVSVALTAGQPVVIFVDGYAGASGAFQLHIGPLSTATPTSTRTPTSTPRSTRTPSPLPPIAGDCGHDQLTSINDLQKCINWFLGDEFLIVQDCLPCDVDGDGSVGIDEIQKVVNCFLDAADPFCPRASVYDGVCGNGQREGSETCDDGNNYGGDGCAANCTLETDLTLNLGDQASTQSGAIVQTIQFSLALPITGSQIFTIGQPRTRPVRGADGFTNFEGNELPFAGVVEKNRGRIEPVVVPGLVCACLRNVTLQACGGRTVVPGDKSKICTLDVFENIDPSVCPANDPCKPVFGPGVSLAGSISCNGGRDLNYDLIANSSTLQTTFQRGGGEADVGGTALAYTALGLIFDGGSCSTEPPGGKKGPDGIPCTDDDAVDVLGDPDLILLTTGSARGAVLNANSQPGQNIDADSSCGQLPCATTADGAAKSCADLLAGDAAGVCMAGAFAKLSEPATGDVVVPTRYCAIE